jgi:hypothetical protein
MPEVDAESRLDELLTPLQAELESAKRRLDELHNYVYGVVAEGEDLDRHELDGYVSSFVEGMDFTGIVGALMDVADPGQAELRRLAADDESWTYNIDNGDERFAVSAFPDEWHVDHYVCRRRGDEKKWERSYRPTERHAALRTALERAAHGGGPWAREQENAVLDAISEKEES